MMWRGWLSAEEMEECWSGVDPTPLTGRTILVAGASGCIGGALAEALCWLAHRGMPVRVIAAARAGARLQRRFAALGAIVQSVDFSSVRSNDLPIFDWAVHAASPASPRHYLAAPVATLQANAVGVAALAERMPVDGRMLFVSSGEIYGSPPAEVVPTPEDYVAATDPTAERACYVEGKRFAEALALAYWRERGRAIVISRPIHVFGPGLAPDDGRVICDFAARAARGQDIEMLSDGSPTRSFCYVTDATRLHLQLLLGAAPGTVCNVGREDPEISIGTLATTVAEVIRPVAVRLGQATHTQGSPQRSCPSMARARALFGFAPRVDLRTGLIRMVTHWRHEGFL